MINYQAIVIFQFKIMIQLTRCSSCIYRLTLLNTKTFLKGQATNGRNAVLVFGKFPYHDSFRRTYI